MNHFDKHKFSELLLRAKGERSINQYALHCGVSAAHISRLVRELIDTSPNPETIRKFADKAYNGVTYKQLMEAAGYIESETTFINKTNKHDNKKNEDIFDQLGTIINRDAKPLTQKDKERLLKIIESAWPVDDEEQS
ncbi:MAG: hypothetical protein ACM3TR_10910 [Caulobacteraceae bacterium]